MLEPFENQLILSGHANETIKVNTITPKKVLIVDDNNYSSLALKSMFQQYGIETDEAISGEEAFELITNRIEHHNDTY